MMEGQVFASHVQKMPALFERLMACDRVALRTQRGWAKLKAVYVLYEGNTACHVGRTRNLAQRLRSHQANSHYSASFAFAQVRLSMGLAATYRKGDGRAAMLERQEVRSEFDRQRERISRMTMRFVQIDDPIDQHLFELYAALELKTPLREFDTS